MNRIYIYICLCGETKRKCEGEDCSLHRRRRRRRRLGGCTYARSKRRRRSYLTKEGHGVTVE